VGMWSTSTWGTCDTATGSVGEDEKEWIYPTTVWNNKFIV
jgi:hypothetical protein